MYSVIGKTYSALVRSMDFNGHEHRRIKELLHRIEKDQGWSHKEAMRLRREARKSER